MAIGDIWNVAVCCYDGAQAGINVLTYQVSTESGAGATPFQIAVAGDAIFQAEMKAAIAGTAMYLGVRAQKIWPLPVGPFDSTLANAGAGTGGAVGAPTGVCGLIAKNTNAGGRRAHGRSYIPFVPVAAVQGDGLPTVAYKNILVTVEADMAITLVAGGGGNTSTLVPVVWSRKFHVANRITNLSHSIFFASQRRRSSYGRPNPPPIP